MSKLLDFLAARKKAIAAFLAPALVKVASIVLPHWGINVDFLDVSTAETIIVAVIGTVTVHQLTNKPTTEGA